MVPIARNPRRLAQRRLTCPATPDLPGDAGDAVAELRAQVAELSRIGSGLEDDMDTVLDLVSELVQGCEGLIRE